MSIGRIPHFCGEISQTYDGNPKRLALENKKPPRTGH